METSPTQTQYAPTNENQMPQWSRIGQLDRSRYPKTMTKDRYLNATGSTQSHTDGNDDDLDAMADSSIRVDYLEKSIRFLKTQHDEILHSLHMEIDKLRRENKG